MAMAVVVVVVVVVMMMTTMLMCFFGSGTRRDGASVAEDQSDNHVHMR